MQGKRYIENVVQEIMGLVNNVLDKREAYQDHQISRNWCEYESARWRLESKLREMVREQEEAKKYLDALAMCMFEKHYAKDEPYASGEVKFELFDSLPGVISQIDNMVSGLERSHDITSTEGMVYNDLH